MVKRALETSKKIEIEPRADQKVMPGKRKLVGNGVERRRNVSNVGGSAFTRQGAGEKEKDRFEKSAMARRGQLKVWEKSHHDSKKAPVPTLPMEERRDWEKRRKKADRSSKKLYGS